MKKQDLLLIVLMSIALVGIIIMQLLWIKNAFDLRKEQFNKDANEIISNTVKKIDVYHTLHFLYGESTNSDSTFKDIQPKMVLSSCKPNDSIIPENNDVLDTTLNITNSPRIKLRLINHKNSVINLTKVIDQIAWEFKTENLPIEKIIDQKNLNQIIRDELRNKNMLGAYSFAVLRGKKDSMTAVKSPDFKRSYIEKSFIIKLFPNEINKSRYKLAVYFPWHNTEIIKSIFYLLAGSFIFTLIIVFTFIYTLYIIRNQKKISEIKSDFINNMTHEFKTPIATISLAVDAIQNPKIIENKEEIKYFTSKIKEENNRMNEQVEKVLQMALLDRKYFTLNFQPVNVHEIIKKVIENISLQIQQKNGKIISLLNAGKADILTDEVHFTNVIFNLLDNANKYSDRDPEITISTKNNNKGIIITVSDKGIGMTKEQQNKIFEKFYRVSTGNIHNTKGFGLGLGYARAIVEANKGSISVKSEKGKGSQFTVFIPYIL